MGSAGVDWVTVDAFFKYARDRHRIYLNRRNGFDAPWTDDIILREFSFTNVFRELDRVTVWFAENARVKDPNYLMNCVVFRLFNRTTTGEVIFNTLHNYMEAGVMTPYEMFLKTGDARVMRQPILDAIPEGPWTTGSYIINSPNGMNKLDGVLQMIQWVWDGRESVEQAMREQGTLKATWMALKQFPHIADFTSYEIVTDLRWTPPLENAPDIMTWANPGPGAMRGLNRINHRKLDSKGNKQKFIDEMRELLEKSKDPKYWPQDHDDWPAMEMRDIEHTLCEFDKYERTRLGQGRPRGKFTKGKG